MRDDTLEREMQFWYLFGFLEIKESPKQMYSCTHTYCTLIPGARNPFIFFLISYKAICINATRFGAWYTYSLFWLQILIVCLEPMCKLAQTFWDVGSETHMWIWCFFLLFFSVKITHTQTLTHKQTKTNVSQTLWTCALTWCISDLNLCNSWEPDLPPCIWISLLLNSR